MQKFRDSVTELENMVVNLIDRIFEEVQTIEEGIEAIYALQRFKYRSSLRETLSTKWVQVRKEFLIQGKVKIRMQSFVYSAIKNTNKYIII